MGSESKTTERVSPERPRTSIRRVKLAEAIGRGGIPQDGQPWIADWRSFDVPRTVVGAIENASPGCVAVTLSLFGGERMVHAAEELRLPTIQSK